MSRRPVSTHTVFLLLVGGLVLPIAISLILALATLLTAMGDAIGGQVLQYIALACGIFWMIDLVCLLLAQGLNSLADRSADDQDQSDG
jgi:uncharacterized membrane protein YhaH (DUF805 family)